MSVSQSENMLVSRRGGVLVLRQELVEDGLDLGTEVEIEPDHAAWLRDTLRLFVANWQTPEQKLARGADRLELFSAGHEADPRVGIQNERAGASFSMIVRLGLADRLAELLSADIPPESSPAVTTKAPPSPPAAPPRVTIARVQTTGPTGDEADAIEIRCGEAILWDWTARDLLAKLKNIRTSIELGQVGPDGAACAIPGETPAEKSEAVESMITTLERFIARRLFKVSGD